MEETNSGFYTSQSPLYNVDSSYNSDHAGEGFEQRIQDLNKNTDCTSTLFSDEKKDDVNLNQSHNSSGVEISVEAPDRNSVEESDGEILGNNLMHANQQPHSLGKDNKNS